jgi:hypothetical protein
MGYRITFRDSNTRISKFRNANALVIGFASGWFWFKPRGNRISSKALVINYPINLSVNFILMLFVAACGLASCNGSDREDKALPPDEINASVRKEPELVYDSKGNITERHSINYRSDNTIRSIENYYYKYDSRNNLVEEIKESMNPKGEPVFKNVNQFTYNELDQKTEQKFFSYDHKNYLQQQARNTFHYNGKGDLIEEKSYYPNGKVKSVIATFRTTDGLLKAEEYIYYNEQGKKTGHKKYSYSRSGLEKTEDLMNK